MRASITPFIRRICPAPIRLWLPFLWFALTSVHASAAELSVMLKGANGEALIDAVVSLVPLDGVARAASATPRVIAQKNQEFTSYVAVVQTGTRVVFPNQDKVQHHVYSLSRAKKFELPLYNPGSKESFVFDVPGVVVLGCNIHDWMLAYLVVVPTPWFAKTDSAGMATVSAPVGRYRLDLWHPRLPAGVSQDVTLVSQADPRRDFTLTLRADKRIRRGGGTKSGNYY